MKIVKTASGKKTIKISKSEWQSIGKKAGWYDDFENAEFDYYFNKGFNEDYKLEKETPPEILKTVNLQESCGCEAAITQDGVILDRPINEDGSITSEWNEVTAPDPLFLSEVNKYFKTNYKMEDFSGR